MEIDEKIIYLNKDEKWFCYIKQNGMYETMEILITDKFIKSKDLPKDWFLIKRKNVSPFYSLKSLLLNIKKNFYSGENFNISFKFEDEFNIKIEELENLYPEHFI